MSGLTFLIAGLGLVLFTIALVLWPLLRAHSEDSRPGLAMVLMALVPVTAIMIYLWIGSPQALDRAASPVDALRADLIALTGDLARNPDQPDAWFVLGMTYKEIRELSSAEHAFRRALYIDDNHSPAMTELAETLLLSAPDRQLPVEARSLLNQALELEPDQQKALWLLGLSARQLGDIDEAVAYWTRLLAVLDANSSVYGLVMEQLGQLGVAIEAPTVPVSAAARLRVELALDPALSAQLNGNESVFVIVQAAGEGAVPTPLAVQRLAVNQLPAVLSFGDDDAMLEGLSMADFDRWQVTARVSMSGEVIPQPGDLQGRSAVIEADSALQTLSLQIDQLLSP